MCTQVHMHIKYLKMIIRKITSLIVALKHEPVGDCLDLGVINVLPTDQKKNGSAYKAYDKPSDLISGLILY